MGVLVSLIILFLPEEVAPAHSSHPHSSHLST